MTGRERAKEEKKERKGEEGVREEEEERAGNGKGE